LVDSGDTGKGRADAAFMGSFDLIIFDCDGVVVDSEALSCGSLVTLFRRHGVEIDLAAVYRHFLGRSFQAVADQYRVWRGAPAPADFRSEWEAEVRASFTQSLQAMPGIAGLLAGLRTPFCLASSSDLDRVRLSLSLAKLSDYFDGRVYTAQMVRHGKPAPDLFLHAASAMGVDPGRALVIEDSAAGVAAGKAAGMTVWGFVGGTHYAGAARNDALLTATGAAEIFATMADVQRRLAGG
jgi:HAD superfamily hydrolase (TIGR01509 family)